MSEGQPSGSPSSKSSQGNSETSQSVDTVKALENIQILLDQNKALLKKAHRHDAAGEVEKNEALLQELHRNIQQVCSKVRKLASTETQGGSGSLEQ